MKKTRIFCVAAAAFFSLTGSVVAAAQIQGVSPLRPASIGITIAGIVECGQGYTSHELYDMKITLLEVIRGEEAWKRLRTASPSNKPAASGQEYVIARIRFEYHARGVPGRCVHQLVPEQFAAYSADGVAYDSPTVVPPKPEMRQGMKSGQTLEGWVAFMVPQQDKSPLMNYSADSGGAVMHGGGTWFKLY
jgi:hypothetical protein